MGHKLFDPMAGRLFTALSAQVSSLAIAAISLLLATLPAKPALAEDVSCEKFRADMITAAAEFHRDRIYLFDEIFAVDEFMTYLEKPQPYVSCAQNLILDQAQPIDARVVAMTSMQTLPQDRLFSLIDTVVEAAIAGKIDQSRTDMVFDGGILKTALFPRHNINAFLDLYYDEPRSRNLLEKADRIPDLDADLRERIDEAKSGESRERLFDAMDIGEPVRMQYRLDDKDIHAFYLLPLGRSICMLWANLISPSCRVANR